MNWLQRIRRYCQEVWGEVKPAEGKVSWPTTDEVKGSTWVVVVTVALVGVYLGTLDLMVGYLVKLLLQVG